MKMISNEINEEDIAYISCLLLDILHDHSILTAKINKRSVLKSLPHFVLEGYDERNI